MNFFELIEKRESCRSYLDKPVEMDKLLNCIKAAGLAPSACNGQPWIFVTVTSLEAVEKMRNFTQPMGSNKFTSTSPAFIVCVEDDTTLTVKMGSKLTKHDFPQIDMGLAVSQLCLAATEQGLATCILGIFDEKGVKEFIGVPKNKRVHLVLCIGYPEDKPPRVKKRKDISLITKNI